MTMNKETTQNEAKNILGNTIDLQTSLGQSSTVQVSTEVLRLLNTIQRSARSILTGNDSADLDEEDQIMAGYRQDVVDLMANLGQMLPFNRADQVSDEDLPEIALACEMTCSRIRNYLTVKNVSLGLKQKKAQAEEEAQNAVA